MSRSGFGGILRAALRPGTHAAGTENGTSADRSPLKLVVVVGLSAFAAEVLVMGALSFFPPLPPLERALVDALLLVTLLTPALYLFLLRPLASEIARRERIEARLRQSEERFRTVADFAHDWEYWIEPGGQYLYNSPSCERITGYSPEDFDEDPRLLEKMTHPDDRDTVEAHFQEERKDDVTHSVDFRIITRSGDVRWLNHVCQQVHDRDGNWLGWRGSNRDITARRRAERAREMLLGRAQRAQARIQELAQALRQERDRLDIIMESTHAHLAYLDADFDFVHVNSAYAEGSGYSKSELVGRNHFDLFPHTGNQAIFERVRDTGAPVAFHAKPFEHPGRPGAGTTYWDWTLVPVKEQGDVKGFVFSLLDVTEREQLMREVQDQRTRLQAIIENAPEAIVVTNVEGRVILANPAARDIYMHPETPGQGPQADARPSFLRADGTRIGPRDFPLTRSAVHGEVHGDLELTFVSPAGDRRDLLVDTVPIRHEGGEIAGAVGLFRDITERKRIEGAVLRYADRLRALHELDQVILSSRSAQEIADGALPRLRRLIDCPLAAVELFDFDQGESFLLAVSSAVDLQPTEGHPTPLPPEGRLERLHQGETYTAGDGQRVEIASLSHQLADHGIRLEASIPLRADDQLLGALTLGVSGQDELTSDEMDVAREVASQVAIGIRQAQLYTEVERYARALEDQVAERTAELRASEERFRAIFEQAAIGITLADMDGQFLLVNPAFQTIVDHTEEELRSMSYVEITHPDDRNASRVLYGELIEGERDHYTVEKRYIRKDGSVIWARLTVSLVRGRDADDRYAVGMVEDITEWKKAQAALIQTEKLNITGRMAASFAHEINNPLQAVIGCLGLAEESLDEGEGEDLDIYVSMAREELARAAEIVSQLRDLSRPAGAPAREPTDLDDLIDTVLELTRKRLESQNIRVNRSTAGDLPELELAPDRIKQILWNLVLNAVDAMPDGGELTVSTRYDRGSDAVIASFSDCGGGIAEDVLPHIFDPFFSTKVDGSGLGLFVSQNIAREHGGSIEVESDEGEGCTFSLRLPVL